MNQQQQQTPGEQLTARSGFNFAYLIVSGHATCFTPFLHRGFGSEALGINGVAALVIILLYATQTGSAAMIHFLWIWLFMMLMQRIKTAIRRGQGHIIHSHYDGEPWLAMKVAKGDQAARGLEPFFCGAAGFLLMGCDEALGTFVAAGFVSLLLKLAFNQRINHVSVQRMRDAEIEQRWLIQQNKTVR